MPGQNFVSQDGTVGYWSTNAPDDFDWTGSEDGLYPVSRLRQQYVDYLAAKQLEIEEQKQSRHYYHAAQWTPDEIEILRKRRQPIITFNRLGRKIDSIVGLVQRLRQDPKAYPRNPQNAEGAEIATECVREVLSGNSWDMVDPYCAQQAGIEGIAGVELKLIQGDHADPDVGLDFIFGDDFFYDPRSYKPDFSDARYMGIAKWLDIEAAVELFPDHEEELRTLMVETGFDLTTHSDREYKWIYVNEKRLRLVEHWYRHKGKWYWAFYCSMILLAQGVSPFVDERNQPMNRFIMWSAAVDHDGDRYGLTRNLKGPQDELNQRRSKALFMSNVSRLIAKKGAVDNVEIARREYARPDGFVEYNQGFDPPKPDDKFQDLAQQLQLMQDARMEIDSFANITPALLSQTAPDEHSGVAINLLQKAGVAELGAYLRNYRDWKLRVYRAVWNVVVRTWQQERFIRVTGNQGLAQFIQINGTEHDQFGQPVIINAIGNLQVEMTMDEGPNEESMLQDTFDQIKGDPNIPFAVKLEFMPIAAEKKKRIQQLMNQPPNPLMVQKAQLENARTAAEVQEKTAGTQHRRAQVVQTLASAAKDAVQAHSDFHSIFRDNAIAQRDLAQPAEGGDPDGAPQGSPATQPAPAPQPQIPPPAARWPIHPPPVIGPLNQAPGQGYGEHLRRLMRNAA